MTTTNRTTRRETLTALRERVRRIESAGPVHDGDIVSTGCEALDRLFPQNGIRRGALVEWMYDGGGQGAGSLALVAARQVCANGGALVVIDREGRFYPPSAAALGIDLNDLVLIRPKNPRDELWAFDQSLRCEAVSAVWGHLEKITGRSFRRLQLAAEEGGSVGLLIRSLKRLKEPTWAEVSLRVRFCSDERSPRFHVEVVRCQGGQGGSAALCLRPPGTGTEGPVGLHSCLQNLLPGGSGEFDIDEATGKILSTTRHETHSVHLVSQLAHSANPCRKTET